MYMPDGHIGLLFYIHAEQYQKKEDMPQRTHPLSSFN